MPQDLEQIVILHRWFEGGLRRALVHSTEAIMWTRLEILKSIIVGGCGVLALSACVGEDPSSVRTSKDESSPGNNSSSSASASNGGTPSSSNGGPATPNGPNGQPSNGGTSSGGNTPSIPQPSMTVTSESIPVGANARSFVLSVPNPIQPGRVYPLVLALHGDGMDGTLMRAASHFDSYSGEDAIVAYPSGASRTWNLYDPPDTNEDVTFITSLVASLSTRFSIDQTRVFGIGFSSGAFMVSQLSCRRPNLFRGIVPNSGGAPSEPRDPAAAKWDNGYTKCAAQTALGIGPAVMVIHGTDDGVVTYQSGEFASRYWAYVDGCAQTQSGSRPNGLPAVCLGYDACPPGKPVVMCPITNLGHSIWAEGSKTAWTFFQGL